MFTGEDCITAVAAVIQQLQRRILLRKFFMAPQLFCGASQLRVRS